MDDQIRKIVAELPRLTDVTGVWKLADDRLAQGDADFVGDLGVALAERHDDEGIWQYRSVLDHLLRLLATTEGAGNAAQAVRLASSAGIGGPNLDRYLASMLASARRPQDVAAVFTGADASDELRACLVQELVLRGVAVAETPEIADWTASPQWRRHPLARLPLKLSDVEEHPDLPQYGRGGVSHGIPYGPSTDRVMAASGNARVPEAAETTTEAAAALIAKAVANWAEESNGRIEAGVFALAEPLDAESVPDALLTVGLECINGAGGELSITSCPPSQAWRLLFAAASTGGAYNSGSFGAYGRLAAWQSLAGLSGTPDDAAIDEVEARVTGCAWYAFEAATDWFDRVAWDIGLAALTPDRRRLAILAATDTD
ncbi:hypothetical protein E1264_28605 [Actinomadura sp. KC216]|uniref:DUF6183 family protein n=1 Tax=Actinomadura sp. KC216 TaxID=2530370 RepID=UPI0010495228|nr:DUF6183 family protein [Actinomadura sp. KC216]TDB83395.1 hypothetical protein E1264_28605 [Actinomadura sp. KC216]